MTKTEALKMALDGHRVRCLEWAKHEFIYWDGFSFKFDDQLVVSSLQNVGDWEIYQEPKQKKLVELKCYGEAGYVMLTINDEIRVEIPYTIKDGKIFIEVEELK